MLFLLFSGWLSVTSSATHKQIGPFWCWLPLGWVCVCSRTPWVSPTNTPFKLGVLFQLQLPQDFSVRGFEACFPHTGTLGCVVCLASQLFLLVFLHANVGLCLPASTLPCILSTPAACLCPSSGSGLMFNCLVFGLPYNLIFWHFWLFLFLNLLLSSFWLYEEAKYIYL